MPLRNRALWLIAMLVAPSFGLEAQTDTSIVWMQSVLDRWQSIATQTLRVPPQPLAWIIFYDGTQAWHVNADTSQLPRPHATVATVRFANRSYPVHRVDNRDALWVPGRDALPLRPRTVAMLYDNGRKPFIIIPVPALYRQLSSADQTAELDQAFFGLIAHELTHTRHLAAFARRVDSLRARYKLPEDLDERAIENRYGNDTTYVPMFEDERDALFTAVFTDDAAAARELVRKALAIADNRKRLFFVERDAGYATLDDLFLVLEGTGMWVQFKTEASAAPSARDARRALDALFRRTRSWSQIEGLALFVLLDRFSPGWQTRFMAGQFPSPFAALRTAVR